MARRKVASGRREARRDIPLIVDAVRGGKELTLVRCNYMSVECDTPQAGWSLDVAGASMPFMMLGLSGIIVSPPGSRRFLSPESIEELFRAIEDEGGMAIDVDDVWLPMFLFTDIEQVPRNGEVYRIDSEAFVLANSFKENRISLARYLEMCWRLERPLSPSMEEREAFASWHRSLIDSAIRQYPKNSDYELEWQEEPQT